MKKYSFSPTDMNLILSEWEAYKIDSHRRLGEKQKEIAKRYGFALKLERCRRRFSQEKFAELVGMSYSHMSKVESGAVLVSPRLHAVIVETLRATPEVTYNGRHKQVPIVNPVCST